MALTKAEIKILDGEDKNEVIPVMFNPSEYKISKQVNYGTIDIQSKDGKIVTYKNGEPRTLSLELFFNCDIKYTNKEQRKSEENVRKYTARILKLTKCTNEYHPPTCLFKWGNFTFAGYVTSVEETYTRFTEEGVPIRATVNLSMMEKPDHSDNALTSSTINSYGSIQSDTSEELCVQSINPNNWRELAEKQGIINPRTKSKQ